MRIIHEIDEIQENIDPENVISPQQISLVQATANVLKLRRSEFKISNFILSHLFPYQKDHL